MKSGIVLSLAAAAILLMGIPASANPIVYEDFVQIGVHMGDYQEALKEYQYDHTIDPSIDPAEVISVQLIIDTAGVHFPTNPVSLNSIQIVATSGASSVVLGVLEPNWWDETVDTVLTLDPAMIQLLFNSLGPNGEFTIVLTSAYLGDGNYEDMDIVSSTLRITHGREPVPEPATLILLGGGLLIGLVGASRSRRS